MSTQEKYTPGPWRWGRTTVNTGTGAHEGDLQLVTEHRPIYLNDPVVLTVREDWTSHLLRHPEGQANARLIAKAPEMYAIIKAQIARAEVAFGVGQSIDPELEQARALLAEIDGEGGHA